MYMYMYNSLMSQGGIAHKPGYHIPKVYQNDCRYHIMTPSHACCIIRLGLQFSSPKAHSYIAVMGRAGVIKQKALDIPTVKFT